MRGWAFVPLGFVLALVALVAAQPGPMPRWQVLFASAAILVMLPLTGELFEDMSEWEEQRRIERGEVF